MRPPPDVRSEELKRLFRYRGSSEITVANEAADFLDQHGHKDAVAIGKILKLTWEEKRPDNLGIRTIAAYDCDPEVVQAYYRERRRLRDRIRKRRQRLHKRRTTGISPRAKQLASGLNQQWASIEVLAGCLKSPGRSSKHKTLLRAAREAGQELCELGIAERKTEVGGRHGRHSGRALFLRWNLATSYCRDDFPPPKRKRLDPAGRKWENNSRYNGLVHHYTLELYK